MALFKVIVKKSVGSSTLATYILDIYVHLGFLILSLWMQLNLKKVRKDSSKIFEQILGKQKLAEAQLEEIHRMYSNWVEADG